MTTEPSAHGWLGWRGGWGILVSGATILGSGRGVGGSGVSHSISSRIEKRLDKIEETMHRQEQQLQKIQNTVYNYRGLLQSYANNQAEVKRMLSAQANLPNMVLEGNNVSMLTYTLLMRFAELYLTSE